MKRLTIPALAMLAGAFLLSACTREPANLGGRMRAAITPPGVIAGWIIQGRNDFMLFDLRDPTEFDQGHLPHAVQVDPAKLRDPDIVRGLPDYKALVFYGHSEEPDAKLLEPLFERGLHVIILEGGYMGWERHVLSKPRSVATPEEAKRDAMARFFRGESALGTPQPLKDIPADKYLKPAALPPARPPQSYESEGC